MLPPKLRAGSRLTPSPNPHQPRPGDRIGDDVNQRPALSPNVLRDHREAARQHLAPLS